MQVLRADLRSLSLSFKLPALPYKCRDKTRKFKTSLTTKTWKTKKKKKLKRKKKWKTQKTQRNKQSSEVSSILFEIRSSFWAVNASAHCFSNPHILFTVQHNHIYVFTEAPFSSLGYSRYELLKTILFFSTPKLRNIRQ